MSSTSSSSTPERPTLRIRGRGRGARGGRVRAGVRTRGGRTPAASRAAESALEIIEGKKTRMKVELLCMYNVHTVHLPKNFRYNLALFGALCIDVFDNLGC